MARSLPLLAIGLASLTLGAEQEPLLPPVKARNPFTENFKSFVQDVMEEWHMPGLAISVVDGDETFTDAYGYATLPDVPATSDTLWYGGSTTKAHVTATLANIISSGNYNATFPLGWKTPISHILPDDFVMPDDWATNHITLEDAASHRTGLTRHDFSVTYDEEHHDMIIRETVRNLRNLPMTLEPRTTFSYNNLMYTTLAHVVETVTGARLGDVLRDGHWGALGMNATFLDRQNAEDSKHHLSQGYYYDEQGKAYKPMASPPSAALNGAGAVISTVGDYAEWVRCLLRECDAISAAAHREIKTARMIESPFGAQGSGLQTYALGWFKTTLYGEEVYWHSGSVATHAALVYFFPERDYAVTIFVNRVARSIGALMYRLIEERFGVPEEVRFDYLDSQRKAEKRSRAVRENATSILYPSIPSPPIPPALSPSSYAGEYHNVGYGSLQFHLTEDGLLEAVADKKEWAAVIRLDHVSGEFYVVRAHQLNGGFDLDATYRAWFTIGADGKVESLSLEICDPLDELYEGVIQYKRVDQRAQDPSGVLSVL